MMHTPIWRSEDAHLLRNLRESANLDDLVFARMNAISLTQLHELEGQGEGLFYNEQIKANTGNKLLKKLGHAIVQPASAHEQAAELATEMPTKCASAQPLLSAPHLLATPAPMGASSFSLRLFKGKGLNIEPKWAGALLVLCLVTWTVSQARWSELRPAPDAGARTTGAQPLLNLTLVAQQTGPAHNRLDTVSAATMASLTLPLSASPEALKTGTPNPSGAAAGQNSKADCDVQQIQSSAIHESHDPIKAGNYIHFVAQQDVALCVRDHQNKLTRLQLGAGSARSVYGAPPFLVHSANWPGLQVFFQGRRVTGAPERSAHWVFKSKEVPHP
ncbi:hypothetical protein [Limnohabitans sp. 2KL-1]|jgi:hypothetical protein|uniref:hypothetical protein n=1 Tax=Limnohabitans sp. 2KL-1 TaxID=1100699 RepID=UPI0011B265A6|nr:hypothetical protein [Limnohabitans sp. 2KL-1]